MEPIFYTNRIVEKNIDKRRISEKELISSLINDLYTSLYPKCPKNYKLPKNFENLILRILSTNFNVMKNDESIIVNSLLEKVYNSSNNNDNLNKFQNLYSRLTKQKNLTKRWSILYLINSLSQNNYKKINFKGTDILQQNFLKAFSELNNNGNIFSEFLFDYKDINEPKTNNFIIRENGIRNNDLKPKCQYYLKNLYQISDINEQFCENEYQINSNNKTPIQSSPIYPLIINPAKTSLTITEKDIINDLIYIFEGINGKYIAYDAREDAFILNNATPWNEDLYNIVYSLSELGWLYKRIKSYLDILKNNKKIKSQFNQSFAYAIQKELDEYFKLISFFKKSNNNKSGKKINLKNIFLWTLEPKEKLKWIATCCETIYNLNGPAVLSQIYSLKNCLGNNSNTFLNNILNEVAKPFLTFVINWIKYGELEDPYKEFFVEIIDGINEDDIWNFKYQLIAQKVPNFMKRDKTIKIFEVGKGIHFLRNYCQEKFNLYNLNEILKNIIDNKNSIISNNDIKEEEKQKFLSEIESLNDCYEFINYIFDNLNNEKIMNISFIKIINNNIDIVHSLINEKIIKIIFSKFKFNSNLESINKYLLLGQGDMMQTLIESLYEELDKPSKSIIKHNLESYLNTSIKASNSDIKDAENIKKLNIILLDAAPGDVGWDVFCLEYNVELPLKVIFNNKLLKEYQKLFLFFWKIKRIKFGQINIVWNKIKNINLNSNKIKNKSFLKKLVKTSIFFNQEIVHFITNLHNYFALEVLETQYKKLKIELTQVKNLNELINKHKIFVENIKKQCLLDENNRTLVIKLSEIFDIIFKFKKVFDVLYSYINEINFENSYNFSRIKNIEEYLKQIDGLYIEYKAKLIEFIKIIDLLGKNNIKYLSMKLDFNYYYSTIEKEKEQQKNLNAIKNINNEIIRKKILKDDEDDYTNEYHPNEDSKNNYEENNQIINNNRLNNENKNNIKNFINDEDEVNEEEEKIEKRSEDQEEKSKDDENINFSNNINLLEDNNNIKENNNNINEFNSRKNDSENNININNNENENSKMNNFVYMKQKLKDNIINNNIINLNKEENINNINKTKNEENLSPDEFTYQYEENNTNENELIEESEDNNNEIENNEEEIDEEDKIVTNIVPKIYGLSAKQKPKNDTNDNQ